MKLNKKIIAGAVAVVCLAVAVFGGIKTFSSNKESEDVNKVLAKSALEDSEKSEKENATINDKNKNEENIDLSNSTEIVWAVPDAFTIKEGNIEALNEMLYKDGYDIKLRINILPYYEYRDNLKRVIEGNKTDIAFVGLKHKNLYEDLKSGMFQELTELLQTEDGKKLYEAFPEKLWQSVSCDKTIYSIPTIAADDQGVYFAFNTDYVDQNLIDNFDGKSIDELKKILDKVEWTDEKNPPFQYMIDRFDFTEMLGCDYEDGILYDYEAKKIMNPLDNSKFVDYLKTMNELRQKGYLPSSLKMVDNTGANDDSVTSILEDRKFAVAMGAGAVDPCLDKEGIIIVKAPVYLESRIAGSTGISSTSQNKEKALKLLSLLYSNDKYANTLMYGVEGRDYKVENDMAVNLDGTPIQNSIMDQICFNIFMYILPVEGERFAENRKDQIFAFYNEVEDNPFLGFELDSEYRDEKVDLEMESLLAKSLSGNINESIEVAKKNLTKNNIKSLVDGANSKWKEYQK